MPFLFDAAIGRYRDTDSGRLIPESRVRLAVDQVADLASKRLAALSQRVLTGELRLSEWQLEAMRVVKTANVAAGVIARGGKARMTPSDWGYLGRRIRDEYAYLRGMASDVESGAQVLDGRFPARSRLYGQGARVTFEAVRSRDAAGYGYQQERSVLHPAEHCAGCIGEAARGWVDVGTLIPIGSRTCLSNCRCTIARRRTRTSEARHLRAVS